MLRNEVDDFGLLGLSVNGMTYFPLRCWRADMRHKCAKRFVVEMIREKNVCVSEQNGTEFARYIFVCVGVKERIFLASSKSLEKKPVGIRAFFISTDETEVGDVC